MKNKTKSFLHESFIIQEGPGVRNSQFTNEGIKLLNVGNIEKNGEINLDKTSRFISEKEAYSKYKHFLCDVGDLVIASSGINIDDDKLLRTRSAFVKKQHLPLCMNTSTIRFKSINNNSLLYLKHWFQSLDFRSQITRLVTGSAQKNFGPSHLKKIRISLPSILDQVKISEILDIVENAISKRKKTIKLLNELRFSCFDKLIRENKSKNDDIPISSIVEKIFKIDPSKRIKNDKFTYIDIASINNKLKLISKTKIIPKINAPSRARQLVQKNDILVSGVRPNLNAVAMIKDNYNDPIASTGFCVLRCDVTKILPEFLFCVVQSGEFINQMTHLTNGAAYPAVSEKMIKSFRIPKIPMSKQIKFRDFIINYDIQKKNLLSHLDKLNSLLNSIHNKFFYQN